MLKPTHSVKIEPTQEVYPVKIRRTYILRDQERVELIFDKPITAHLYDESKEKSLINLLVHGVKVRTESLLEHGGDGLESHFGKILTGMSGSIDYELVQRACKEELAKLIKEKEKPDKNKKD